jgi:hypothetical protein
MSEINYFKKFILYTIMLYDIVVIYQLLDDVAVDNWWMIGYLTCQKIILNNL